MGAASVLKGISSQEKAWRFCSTGFTFHWEGEDSRHVHKNQNESGFLLTSFSVVQNSVEKAQLRLLCEKVKLRAQSGQSKNNFWEALVLRDRWDEVFEADGFLRVELQ